MAGLACGEPNPIAWEIIKRYANHFVHCDDDYARAGMKLVCFSLAQKEPLTLKTMHGLWAKLKATRGSLFCVVEYCTQVLDNIVYSST